MTRITDFLDWLRAGGQTPGTVNTRRWWITRAAGDLSPTTPETVTATQLTGWLANASWGPSTRKSALASLRRFFRWMRLAGHREDDPTALMLSITVPRHRARPTPDEALTAAFTRATSTEDRLMLLLGAYAGLRRTEIAALHTEHVHLTAAGSWLSITGKGGVTRQIPIHPALKPVLALKTTGWVFPGRFEGHRSSDAVGRRLSHLLGPGLTPHTLRHWFATTVYAGTHDLRAVQELLGHADISTTQTYIGLQSDQLEQAVASLPTAVLPVTDVQAASMARGQ